MKQLNDLDLGGKRVLIRVDFNVPLSTAADGTRTVEDDTRIRAAIPTIEYVTSQGGTAILVSHLGRPKGEVKPEFSMAPVGRHLSLLTGQPVVMAPAVVGNDVADIVRSVAPGEVLLLENVRFEPGETTNDPALAQQLASLADVYVNDAFGTAHRAHASTEGVAHLVAEKAPGFLMQAELDTLTRLTGHPEKPFVAIVGGAKVSDKIGIISRLLDTADHLLIGGAMAYTFLRAKGMATGTSLVEEDRIDLAADVLDRAAGRIHLPLDHVCAQAFDNDAPQQTVEGSIPEGWMGLDIGPATVSAYANIIDGARTIVWNGPMGVFEMASFAKGTYAIADAVVAATDKGAFSVVGGGDSVAAIVGAGKADRVSHVSTGGGAMLELLEGKVLPGIKALEA
ncbi:MAG: phosphoglycerate kinase [Rhodothermales bacterium]